MFTSLVLPKSSAGEGRGREGEGGKETARKLVPDEGMLKTGRVVAFRSFQGGHQERRWLRIMPRSLALIIPERSTPSLSLAVCAYACVLCARVCVRVRLSVRPTYRRLLATLLRRAHRLAGMRRTCPHHVVSDSTGCPGKNLPDPEPRGRSRNEIARRGRPAVEDAPVETASSGKAALFAFI